MLRGGASGVKGSSMREYVRGDVPGTRVSLFVVNKLKYFS